MSLKQRKQKVNQLSVKEYDRIQNSTTEFIIQSIKKKNNYSTNEGPRKGHPFLKGKTITRDQKDAEVSSLGFQNAFEQPFFDLKKNRTTNH